MLASSFREHEVELEISLCDNVLDDGCDWTEVLLSKHEVCVTIGGIIFIEEALVQSDRPLVAIRESSIPLLGRS